MSDTCEQHENSIKLLVDEMSPRPVGSDVHIKCGGCEKDMIVRLEWWRCMNNGCEGKWWIKDELDCLHIDYLYCDACNEKARPTCSR